MHTSALIKDGKKVYNRGRVVSWVVDSEEYAIIDLEKDITPYFIWDDNQKANFQVLTGSDLTCLLTSDSQLLDLLRASQLVKFLMIVSRCEGNEMRVAVNMDVEDIPSATNVVKDMQIGEFKWAEVAEYGETTAGPPMVEEDEKENFMTVGCDPHGDEPAGVDEEWTYYKNQIMRFLMQIQQRCRKKKTKPIDFDTECVPEDEFTMIDDCVVPHTTHDSENPIIKEG